MHSFKTPFKVYIIRTDDDDDTRVKYRQTPTHRYGHTCVNGRELLLLSLLLVRVPSDCLLFFSTSNLHFTRFQKKK